MDDLDMGFKFYSKKKYEEAMVYFKKYLEEHEEANIALYNIGVCHIRLNNYDEAIDIFNQVLNKKSASSITIANSLFNIGYSYISLKEIGKAYQYIARSWSINPFDEECRKSLLLIEKHFLKENVE